MVREIFFFFEKFDFFFTWLYLIDLFFYWTRFVDFNFFERDIKIIFLEEKKYFNILFRTLL